MCVWRYFSSSGRPKFFTIKSPKSARITESSSEKFLIVIDLDADNRSSGTVIYLSRIPTIGRFFGTVEMLTRELSEVTNITGDLAYIGESRPV
jgi:hypothetical protein